MEIPDGFGLSSPACEISIGTEFSRNTLLNVCHFTTTKYFTKVMSSNRPYLNEVYKKQQGILFQYFVERDYSTGTCPKFQKTFPRVLRSRVSAVLAY